VQGENALLLAVVKRNVAEAIGSGTHAAHFVINGLRIG
jgi:hypothetical protein